MGTARSLREVGRASLLRLVSHHPRNSHPRRAGHPQGAQGQDPPVRGRDRRHLYRHRCRIRRQLRRDHHLRSRSLPEVRGPRSGHDHRAAPRTRGRAAQRSVHRYSHQDRADRPQPGPLRPQRRVPHHGDGRPLSFGLLRESILCRQVRHGAHDARYPPYRGLPGQRLRALAHSFHEGPARDTSSLHQGRLLSADGLCPELPVWSTASAVWRKVLPE